MPTVHFFQKKLSTESMALVVVSREATISVSTDSTDSLYNPLEPSFTICLSLAIMAGL